MADQHTIDFTMGQARHIAAHLELQEKRYAAAQLIVFIEGNEALGFNDEQTVRWVTEDTAVFLEVTGAIFFLMMFQAETFPTNPIQAITPPRKPGFPSDVLYFTKDGLEVVPQYV